MLVNSASYYPNKVDEMIFFQDNDIEKVPIITQYENLISQGKYNEANKFINQQEGVYGYFADFFNAIENRIYSLQDYLLTKQKINPFVSDDEEPTSITSDTIWI